MTTVTSTTPPTSLPTQSLVAGQTYDGFRLDQVTPLPSLRATAYQFEHVKSGARVLHLHTNDTENCFSVTFPTPPADDTGLPHILEHAVLGGSRKYPVREPFFEMVKMSMATFINAMTSQAYTTYPIATNNKKDFFNLAEVYVDAVFFPELKESTFRREGHHLSLVDNNDLTSALKVTGIVYNEMKGAYSSPESLMWKAIERNLFPDTVLGNDSGGDPDYIPELTFEQFKRFFEDRYHPSNALVFIYGDIPSVDHLRFLAPTFEQFKRRPASIATPRQARWSEPRRITRAYPIAPTDETKARTFITVNWLIGDGLDPDTFVAWWALYLVLMGNEAAPLKKAIIDSKLGADVVFTGAYPHAWESVFSVGLKGAESDRADAFENLVRDTLDAVARDGITKERVDAAFQQLTYSQLEINSGYPMRLQNMSNMAWPYGRDPLVFLRMSEHLNACRERVNKDPGIFARMIRECVLSNPHMLRVTLTPDQTMQSKADQAFAKKMAEQRATFNASQIATIAREAAALEAAQGVANSPEALAKLPQLRTTDLPATLRNVPTAVADIAGATVLHNNVFANGVNYFEFQIDLAGLDPDLYAYLPQFSDAFNKMGAAGQNYERIAARRAASTGGLWCGVSSTRHAAQPWKSIRRLHITLKTLDAEAGDALSLLEDLVFSLDPTDKSRLRDLQTQRRANMRTSLVNDGMGTASRRASRGLSPDAALSYLWGGPPTLSLLDDLDLRFDTHCDDLIERIARIAEVLRQSERWTVSFTGSDSVYRQLENKLGSWATRLAKRTPNDAPAPFTPQATPPWEALAGPMKVAYCVRSMLAPSATHPDTPLFGLAIYLTRFDYLLPEIRFKGNAYGGGASFDDGSGLFTLYSYRDPRIVETLAVFDGLRAFVDKAPWTQTDIDRAIIGSAKTADPPIRPDAATGIAMARYVRGDTNEMRQQRYETMLRATPRDVRRAMLEQLDRNSPAAATCVVSSREKLDEANKALGDRPLSIENILP